MGGEALWIRIFCGQDGSVTGGSRGIGRAVALKLAAAGASVVICGRTEETLNCTAEEIRAHGVSAWPQRADVSRLEDIDALFAAIESGPGGMTFSSTTQSRPAARHSTN